MKNTLPLTTTEKIFRIRNYLQQISHISFSFSKINQKYPIEELTEEEAKEVIQAYKNLLLDTETIIKTYKSISGDD